MEPCCSKKSKNLHETCALAQAQPACFEREKSSISWEGWKFQWTRPAGSACYVRAVVPGPFVNPRLVKALPYVVVGSSCGASNELPVRKPRNGIPDPWLEYLRRECVDDPEISQKDAKMSEEYLRLTNVLWTRKGVAMIQGIPDPWKPDMIGVCNEANCCVKSRRTKPREQEPCREKVREKIDRCLCSSHVLEKACINADELNKICPQPQKLRDLSHFDMVRQQMSQLNKELISKELEKQHTLREVEKFRLMLEKKRKKMMNASYSEKNRKHSGETICVPLLIKKSKCKLKKHKRRSVPRTDGESCCKPCESSSKKTGKASGRRANREYEFSTPECSESSEESCSCSPHRAPPCHEKSRRQSHHESRQQSTQVPSSTRQKRALIFAHRFSTELRPSSRRKTSSIFPGRTRRHLKDIPKLSSLDEGLEENQRSHDDPRESVRSLLPKRRSSRRESEILPDSRRQNGRSIFPGLKSQSSRRNTVLVLPKVEPTCNCSPRCEPRDSERSRQCKRRTTVDSATMPMDYYQPRDSTSRRNSRRDSHEMPRERTRRTSESPPCGETCAIPDLKSSRSSRSPTKEKSEVPCDGNCGRLYRIPTAERSSSSEPEEHPTKRNQFVRKNQPIEKQESSCSCSEPEQVEACKLHPENVRKSCACVSGETTSLSSVKNDAQKVLEEIKHRIKVTTDAMDTQNTKDQKAKKLLKSRNSVDLEKKQRILECFKNDGEKDGAKDEGKNGGKDGGKNGGKDGGKRLSFEKRERGAGEVINDLFLGPRRVVNKKKVKDEKCEMQWCEKVSMLFDRSPRDRQANPGIIDRGMSNKLACYTEDFYRKSDEGNCKTTTGKFDEQIIVQSFSDED